MEQSQRKNVWRNLKGSDPLNSCGPLGRYFYIVSLLLVFALISCSGPFTKGPGTTLGTITVDSPEIYTRERLVNDRYRQDTWLLDQLNKTDQLGFGHQGLKDLRQFTGILSRTGIQVIPTAKMPKEGTGAETKPGTQSEIKPGSTGIKYEKDIDTQFGKELSEKERRLTVTPAELETTQAVVSQVDVFRDKLAYREEVRNEIVENQLDDRHDLDGNTLYRLKFDATIIPGVDTSAWAWIEVKIIDAYKQDDFSSLYDHLTNNLNETVNRTYAEERLAILSGQFSQKDKLEIIQFALDNLIRPQETTAVLPEPATAPRMYEVFEAILRELERHGQRTLSVEDIDKHLEVIIQLLASEHNDYKGLDKKQAINRLVADKLVHNIQQRLENFLELKVATIGKGHYRIDVDYDDDNGLALAESTAKKRALYSYAVTPKEAVQRISDVASRRDDSQFLLALGATLGSVGLDSVINFMKESYTAPLEE